jgi:hypothetical protein
VEDKSDVHDERQAHTVADEINDTCEQISFAEEIAITFLDDQILSDKHSLDTTPALLSEVNAGGGLLQSNESLGSTMQSDDEWRQETSE